MFTGKKIAHYAPNLWAKGGIATYVRRLGEAQVRAGYEVIYFSQNPNDRTRQAGTHVVNTEAELFKATEDQQCDVLHLHKPVHYLPAKRITTVRTMHGNQGSCPTGTRYLVKSQKPCTQLYSPIGCMVKHFTERCGSLKSAKVKRNFGGIKNELKLGKQIHTFTVSGFLRDWMVKTGYDDQRLHVLQSPAPDLEEETTPPPQSGIPRFVFLGRLVPQKGAQWLLRALNQTAADVRIDIAGDGPLRDTLEAYCQKHGLSHKVVFHGWVEQPKARALMKEARAVVFPSVWQEPAGLVTLEAAASQRPVIASRAGGIPEYAREDFAVLVAPNDVASLAGAIDQLAMDYTLAAQMGVSALKAAREQCSLAGFLEKQLALYQLAKEEPELELTEIDRN